MTILQKIKQAKLVGRGGACFPTADKWAVVKNEKAKFKYVICNASEGEPDILKDAFILENHPMRVIDGVMEAINFLRAEKGIIYLNPKYFSKYENLLNKVIGELPIELFRKPHQAGYIGGEETSLINAIEGKRAEPRLRPPFPTVRGLWGYPTLVNNVETFYNVSLVKKGEFKQERFYTVTGDCHSQGVYLDSEKISIEKLLRKTNNYPEYDFFVQAGGGASGVVLNKKQLKVPVGGGGSITIYSLSKHKPLDIINKWLGFFVRESCGNCVPCREGTLRLKQIANSNNPDWQLFAELLENLSETAFCGLGCAVPFPLESYFRNVLLPRNQIEIELKGAKHKMFCDCFGGDNT